MSKPEPGIGLELAVMFEPWQHKSSEAIDIRQQSAAASVRIVVVEPQTHHSAKRLTSVPSTSP